jgi:PAS domain S-box-containing protein
VDGTQHSARLPERDPWPPPSPEAQRAQAVLHEAILEAQSDLGHGLVVVEGERIVRANDAFAAMAGRSPEALAALDSFFDLVPPEDVPHHRRGWERRLAGRVRSDRFEATLVKPDGERVEVEVAVKRLPDGEGRPRHVAVVRDITPRKRAEAAHEALLARLDRERVLFECVLRSIPDAVVVAEGGYVRLMNHAALALAGVSDAAELPPEAVHLAGCMGLRDPASKAPLEPSGDPLLQAIAGRTTVREVVVTDALTGEERLHRVAAAPIEVEGFVRAAVAVHTDLTERRRMEDALRASEERFRLLFDASPIAILAFDPRGTLLRLNPAAARTWPNRFGKPGDYNVLRDPRLRALDLGPHLEEAFAGRPLRVPPTCFPAEVLETEEPRWLEAFLFPLAGTGGEGSSEVVCMVQDVTEVKRAEVAMREAKERLEELGRLRTEFFNVVAHELRTPLTPMLLQVDLLRSWARDPAQRAAVDILDRAVGRLNRLLDEVLDAARVERGSLTVRPELVDLGRLVREAAGMFEATVQQAGLALEVDAPPRLEVRADPQRLAQVLFNLLSNAAKFTAPGGTVRMRVVEGEEEEVRVEVVDTGRGLSPEQQQHLFEPFSRVQGGPRVAGTGLGLFISKGIVESHGGRIGAHSEGPGRGSTFWFTLPRG